MSRRKRPAEDCDIETAADCLVEWAEEQALWRAIVRDASDKARAEGRLMYSAPEAMR